MPEKPSSHRVSLRSVIAAPVERVWSAWVEPEQLTGWYADSIQGSLAARGQRAVASWDSLGMSIELEVIERVERRRLVVRAELGSGAQTQRIMLSAVDGGTEILLEHDGLLSRDEREGVESGWTIALALLREYVERYPGQTRRSFAILGGARAALPRIYAQFVRPGWLADPPPRLTMGRRVALRVRGGPSLWVEVIADVPGRELALRCSEMSAVIALRALPARPIWLAGAIVSCWSTDTAAIEALERALTTGVQRLLAAFGDGIPQA